MMLITLLLSCTAQNRLPGHVYYRLKTNPTTLDPALISDVTGGSLAAKLYNGLVRLDKGLRVVPDLAESFSASPDGLSYTFRLRRGVLFSNGRELVARDVKYTFERVLDPVTRSPTTWVLDRIDGARKFMKKPTPSGVSGITVLDAYTVRITLKEPFSPFLSLLTMPTAYIVPGEEVEKWGADFSSHPSGTGPFRLKQWLQNRELVLTRRDGYFGGPAKVQGMVYRIIPESLTTVTEFELGNLDVITIPSSVYARFRDDKKWAGLISSTEGLNTYYLGMNSSRAPLENPQLRRAIAHAIDTEKILRTLHEGRGRLAKGPVPDLLRTWELENPLVYDPARARALVSEGGFGRVELDFLITADEEVVDTAEVIQSYLVGAGLKVRIKQLEWSAFKEAVNRGEADLFWLSWWADYPDPENFLFPLFHSANLGPGGNRARYVNPEVDRLIEEGQGAATREGRDRAYARAESIVVADAPWVFFWHRNDYALRQPWVKGYDTYPIYSMDKGTDIEL